MASSRLEKIGTIFTRVNGLLKTGAMKWEERPLWYDVYQSFPPNVEPRFDKPAPNIEVKSIFYEEDKIRALYHKNNKNVGTINLLNNETQTKTMKFIEIYKKLAVSDSVTEEQLYENAMQLFFLEMSKQSTTEPTTLTSSFKDAQEKLHNKIDVSKIFNE